jgi:hypothetical protein
MRDTYNPLLILLKKNRRPLALTYGLTLVEQLLALLVPWAIGIAINGLLVHDYDGLFVFVSLWVSLVLLTVGRKMYDTRVFMRIYAALVTGVIERQREAGTSSGKLVARSVLLREIVDFFERDIPDIFALVIAFVGSLLMLALFDWHIDVVALVMMIPVLVLNGLMWRPINRLNHGINNNLERQTRMISHGSLTALAKHFRFLRLLRVKTSDIEAKTWVMIELCVLLASIYVLIYTASIPAIQSGTIFSIVTYFWNFQESLDRLPVLMQSVSRVKDILHRIGDNDTLLEDNPTP